MLPVLATPSTAGTIAKISRSQDNISRKGYENDHVDSDDDYGDDDDDDDNRNPKRPKARYS